MDKPADDKRSCERRDRNEHIAAEPRLSPLDLPVNAISSPVETYLSRQHCRPVAVMGVVENGMVPPSIPLWNCQNILG